MQSRSFIRNIDAGRYLENFLVSSISSILLIRFCLYITGYPKLDGAGLHIAHMLWGGLIMLVAIVLLLTFFNRTIDKLSAILAGVGFGVFVDEIGKFITADNNYFFHPTIAIIYVIFVALYLSTRVIPSHRNYSQKEYLINAIELYKEAIVHGLQGDEKRLAENYLSHADQNEPLVQVLQKRFTKIKTLPLTKPTWYAHLVHTFQNFYRSVTQSKKFIAMLFTSILSLAAVAIIAVVEAYSSSPHSRTPLGTQLEFGEWGIIISAITAAAVLCVGLFFFASNRLQGYYLFRLAILINIFFTQFFLFYQFQFYGLIGLIINMSLLSFLNYTITFARK